MTTDVYTHYTRSAKLEAVNSAFAKYLPAVIGEEMDYTDRLSA